MELLFEGVAKSWGSEDRSFTLSVPHLRLTGGRVHILTGENGTGKTTFLELAGLAAAPVAGRITLLGDGVALDVANLWRQAARARLARLRSAHFGYVLQSIHLLPFLTIRENAALAQDCAERPDPAYLDYLFDTLGLSARRNMPPGALSPGLRQRAAVARALAHRPDFIIADEPTAALDPESSATVNGLLLDLAREQGAAVIMSVHASALSLPKDAIHLRTRHLQGQDPNRMRAELGVAA